MSRRVVLVEFHWTRAKDPRIPLAHGSLLASLKHAGVNEVHSVVVARNHSQDPAQEALRAIRLVIGRGASDDITIGIGVYVWSEDVVQELIRKLRGDGFRGQIVLGGPQISYAPGGVAELYPGADVFVRGFGELAIVALALHPNAEMKGVLRVGDDDRAEQSEVDLAELPSPWLTGAIPLRGQRFIRWETQRGCPYRCTFCQHRTVQRLSQLRRSLRDQRVFNEIALFCSSGVRDIAVLDPIFNLGTLSVPVLEHFVRHRYSGNLSLQCRAEKINAGFLDVAGRLNVCLEFGLQTVHEAEGRAVQRRNKIDLVDATLYEVRARGIRHEVSLIYGLPEQTLESFLETVSWCLERRVPVIKAFPLMLLRGTPLERDRDTWGLVDEGGMMPSVVASNTFGPTEVAQMARIAGALELTEGRHPSTLSELMRVARKVRAEPQRWRPGTGRHSRAEEQGITDAW